LSIEHDFYSENFKKLFDYEINKVLDIVGRNEVERNIGNINKVFRRAGELAELAKSTSKVAIIDRHKIAAVVVIAILENEPLIMLKREDTTYLKAAYYANEMLALNIIQRMIYDEMIPEFSAKHGIAIDILVGYLKSLEFPSQTKDEESVEISLKKSLYLVKKMFYMFGAESTTLTGGKKPSAKQREALQLAGNNYALSVLFLISNIVYNLEKHNWDTLLEKSSPPTKEAS
jgi:hypothetical protein